MALTDIEKLRIYIADTTEPTFFTDVELQSFLDDNEGNVPLTADALRPIMGLRMASALAREREGNVEVYGSERASNYLAYLKYFENEGYSVESKLAAPIIGGVSATKNAAVDNDTDSVGPGAKIGMFSSNSSGLFQW